MKAILWHMALLMLLPSAFCQNSVTKTSTPKPPEKDRWNLDKYLFSHTYYKTGKNDKPVIDFEALDNWQAVGEDGHLSFSSDGKYFAYTVVTGSGVKIYNRKKPDSLIVQSTVNSWRHSFLADKPGFFSSDSKQYIFQDKETLCVLKVGGSNYPEMVMGVSSYKIPMKKDNEWLAYQLKDGEVVLRNLVTATQKRFGKVSSYKFDKSSQWLVCQLNNGGKGLQIFNLKNGKEMSFPSLKDFAIDNNGKSLLIKTSTGELSFTDLIRAKTMIIWQPVQPSQILKVIGQDALGSQVVFTVQDGNKMNSIWYYKVGMDKAVMKVSESAKNIDSNLMIREQVSFTDNGRYVQFFMQPEPEDLLQSMTDAVNVDVWSYEDDIIQSAQPEEMKKTKSFSCLINVENNQVVRLENEGEKMTLLHGDYAVVQKNGNALHGDRFWEKGFDKDSIWLVSIRDGSRSLLPLRDGGNTLWFSPGGKYLVYFDGESGCHYFSYDLQNGKITDISPGCDFCWIYPYVRTKENPKGIIGSASGMIGPAAWVKGDKGLLIYDNYDIWQLDLSGKKSPINRTNDYGSKHSTMFTISGGERLIFTYLPKIVSESESILLKAFNFQNKYDGFYRMTVGKTADPEMLCMGPYFFEQQYGVSGSTVDGKGMTPLKAAKANTWIVQRQSTAEAPNYFLTKDFRTYKQLTNLEPEKQYNWYNAELISFPQLDGTLSQGVLYKPDNFDPSKKYPVIFSFYGPLSDRLYQYLEPEYISMPGIFDSPAWLVSHGYLVFLPDIYQTPGQWGPSTVNTIDGAAKYLSKLSYVDSLHIGASGHSNSGTLGYYLLTHSKTFAAMSVGAGITDMLSSALSSLGSLNYFEIGHNIVPGYGTDLWKHKSALVDQTSVLHADQVTSPLLLFHNKNDGQFNAAREMYTALRRLNKPVWWLQYDDGGHTLTKLRDLRDFTIRYTQFFDHYLKGAPVPAWMSKGIPYKFKGVESRYELSSK